MLLNSFLVSRHCVLMVKSDGHRFTSHFCLSEIVIGFFFGGTGVCTEDFALARPVLYQLNHSASPTFLSYLSESVNYNMYLVNLF
jgi:hypothetical protein